MQNSFTNELIHIWCKYRNALASPIAALCPVLANPNFKFQNKNAQCRYWEEIGIYRIRDLFIRGEPISFGWLNQKNPTQIKVNWLQLI